jgi:NAD(P)-dependent dehydrogenase (short-subunit alcohol dehydrogenase family)
VEGISVYHVPTQKGKLAVVTGSNSGTGKEAALRLSAAGASVIIAVRNLEKGDQAKADIVERFPEANLTVRHLDLADLSSVQTFADALIADNVPLDMLLNNGGVMAPPKRMGTIDGFELQFGTNFLGHFALTMRLMPLLLAAAGPVVTTMSSGVATVGSIRFHDLQWQKRYSPYLAYAQSKLADLLFAQHLALIASERKWDLMSNAAHPGFTRTNLLNAGANLGREKPKRSLLGDIKFAPSQDVEQGTEPLLYAATSPDAINGAYYGPNGLFGLVGATTLTKAPRSARSPQKATKLWAVAEKLTGVTLPEQAP